MNFDIRHISLIFIVWLVLSATALAAGYTVSGAPIPDANGLYVENGISDGVPSYSKGIWTMQREFAMGIFWIIRNGSDTFGDIIYINDATPDRPPNDGNWLAWGTGSPIPELRVSLLDPSMGVKNILLLE